MTGSAYARGNHFERRVMSELVGDGFHVWQTRGSKSAADLICLKPGLTVLVQVKGGNDPLDHLSWNLLYALARKVRATPVYATRKGRKIEYRELAGVHLTRSHDWPSKPWTPDEVAA